MVKVTFCIREELFEKIKKTAQFENKSITKFIQDRLEERMGVESRNLSDLYGSITDDTFIRPKQGDLMKQGFE